MQPTLVLNVVGMARALLAHAPALSALAARGGVRDLATITPAVTCSVQSTLLTGELPSRHGIVGNGWYFRDLAEVWLWRQSNHLVQGPKVWDIAKARNAAFTSANMFWWYNMYSSADLSVTPRPQYPADGRKLPDAYSWPPSLRDELTDKFGIFPLFKFWGPAADIQCSQWIARASAFVLQKYSPTLTFVYLPHLDYDLQKLGPNHPRIPASVAAVDALAGELIEQAERAGMAVVALSEYGITEVSGAVMINQALRRAGLLVVRPEKMGEQLDAGASEAFAVVDHQVAHVYVKRPERVAEVAALLRGLDGVERVWLGDEKRTHGLDHERAGDIVVVSRADRWFAYYFWLDDDKAPDYARTVDIHRKPGYDPVELFLDPQLSAPKLKIGMTLLKRKIGFRSLLNVIPLDTSLVKGSHGRVTDDPAAGPLFISNRPDTLPAGSQLAATDVRDVLLQHVFGAA
ncbi:MAG: alkaline phosphatase family protein [Deltaproteobacteria bacterium]|nr:alkaline phosphatase family protein [Deltaproteobacteria bacterium]